MLHPSAASAAPRILIAGCGDVGTALGLELARGGVEVWGLRRRADALPGALHPFPADLRDPATLADLPSALDAVVYAAAADGHDPEAYRAAYVDGPLHLLKALVAQGQAPRRILFTSSTSVYGQSHGEWIDENSSTAPRGFSGELVLEGEGVFASGPFPATSLRLGGIYGPGRTRLLDMVRAGGAVLPREKAYTNRIHRDDAASAIAHLLRRALAGRSIDDVYIGVDNDPAERAVVLRWLAERLGLPEPPVADDAGSRRYGGSKRCRNDRLLGTGYIFRYPSFRQGYAELIDADA